MMQPSDTFAAGHPSIPPQAHLPIDLHMGQSFQYYRYGYGNGQDYHISPTGKQCGDEYMAMSNGPSSRLYWTPDMLQSNQTGVQEVRKEKSRDAARSRRGKENYEFYELAKMLPLPPAITSQLDKASIIRLTISYLKIGEFSSQGDPPWNRSPSKLKQSQLRSRGVPASVLDVYDRHLGTHALQSMDGFPFSLGVDGRFLYVSETVSMYLGLSQVEMCGSSIFDYIHPQDHSEFATLTGLLLSNGRPLASPGEETTGPVGTHNPDVNASMTLESNRDFDGLDRSICVRMKSTLTKRGCHFKTPGYRVLSLQCRLRAQTTFSQSGGKTSTLLGLSGLAIAMPPPNINDVRLEPDMFVTRVSFDLHVVHCEPRVSDLLNYAADDLTGRSLYTLCHGEDVQVLKKAHQDLLQKGQALSHYYRLLNKNCGSVWVQSCLIMVCNSKSSEDQVIICINYLISLPEQESVQMDLCQAPGYVPPKSETCTTRKTAESRNNFSRDICSDSKSSLHPLVNQDSRSSPTLNNSEARSSPTQRTNGPSKSERKSTKRRRHHEDRADENSDKQTSDASLKLPHTLMHPASSTIVPGPDSGDTSSSAVKDLETVMSKHLPSHEPTDFSTDSLLRGHQGSALSSPSSSANVGYSRSTIQWAAAAAAATAPSSLFRQLYGARESVIRSNVQPVSAPSLLQGVGVSSVANSRNYPAEFLPTPPATAPDVFHHHQDSFYPLPTDGRYAPSVVHNGYDYHSMTPPSSVSPRDKAATHLTDLDSRIPTGSASAIGLGVGPGSGHTLRQTANGVQTYPFLSATSSGSLNDTHAAGIYGGSERLGLFSDQGLKLNGLGHQVPRSPVDYETLRPHMTSWCSPSS